MTVKIKASFKKMYIFCYNININPNFTTHIFLFDVFVVVDGGSDAAVKVIRIVTWNTFFVVVRAHLLETSCTSTSGS